jgi:hypothetical protein
MEAHVILITTAGNVGSAAARLLGEALERDE